MQIDCTGYQIPNLPRTLPSPSTLILTTFKNLFIQDLEYDPFYQDFGPLNLGKTWKYVTELEKLLKHPQYLKNTIYHYTSLDFAKAANAAFLMGAFQVPIQ